MIVKRFLSLFILIFLLPPVCIAMCSDEEGCPSDCPIYKHILRLRFLNGFFEIPPASFKKEIVVNIIEDVEEGAKVQLQHKTPELTPFYSGAETSSVANLHAQEMLHTIYCIAPQTRFRFFKDPKKLLQSSDIIINFSAGICDDGKELSDNTLEHFYNLVRQNVSPDLRVINEEGQYDYYLQKHGGLLECEARKSFDAETFIKEIRSKLFAIFHEIRTEMSVLLSENFIIFHALKNTKGILSAENASFADIQPGSEKRKNLILAKSLKPDGELYLESEIPGDDFADITLCVICGPEPLQLLNESDDLILNEISNNSEAAAWLSGTSALLMRLYYDRYKIFPTPSFISKCLLESATPRFKADRSDAVERNGQKFSKIYGRGLLNIEKALKFATADAE